MEKAQYAIMRFAKYKGPEIGNIEAHNERKKEKYASNPDVDTSRSKYNFHLVKPSNRPVSTERNQSGRLPLPDAVPGKTVSV